MTEPTRLLIAASGTGGHLFPALALAQQLPDYQIEWLGVPNRLEQTLVPQDYPLHTITVTGFQGKPSLKTLKILGQLIGAIFQVRRLLQERRIDVVCSTGGYIAGPTILAAKSLGIPVILHESNFIPGKVTYWLGRWCHCVAIGFAGTAKYLPKITTHWVGTPVREPFRSPQPLDLPISPERCLIVVAGGSQGALPLNQRVRPCIPAWVAAGAEIIHLTGQNDPEAETFQHPHYQALPFYDNMAGLLQRADLAISRAGAGTLTELAITQTPAILIPYPFAAEDHQSYNARVFAEAGAAEVYPQRELTSDQLEQQVLALLQNPDQRRAMAEASRRLAIVDSAEQLAVLVRASLN
ncbi:undecaprenyldiphospho-muramoylpentapeptide beta-N-acetylglucosaminyltransferase [Synechocystis sp. LKSZ1]|uniref:undecaprenyldiphospho-muramoylpentapeptide beta-N-acetylglucosaminyltransferase n=1 Tax=Synechocystis sp. LKSZ1 TaxID=3144951 RepID=UPI00336BB7A1